MRQGIVRSRDPGYWSRSREKLPVGGYRRVMSFSIEEEQEGYVRDTVFQSGYTKYLQPALLSYVAASQGDTFRPTPRGPLAIWNWVVEVV